VPTPYTGSSISSVGFTLELYINALIGGTRWGSSVGNPATVTYSFPDGSSVWDWSPNAYPPGWEPDYPDYRGFNTYEQGVFRDVLTAYSNVANITFQEITETSTSVGDIRIAYSGLVGNDGAAAYAFYPDPSSIGGDIWVDPTYPPNLELGKGEWGYSTWMHELGHALGLQHPFSDGDGSSEVVLTGNYQTQMYSIMGYDQSPYATIEAYQLMLYDIAAIQYIYGANMSYEAGDSVYTFSNSSEELRTLWDASGDDTIDASNQTRSITIDLHDGAFSSIGVRNDGKTAQFNVAIAFNAVIENAIGGSNKDTLIGNEAANRLDGGAGIDVLRGNEGNDHYIVDIVANGTGAKMEDTVTETTDNGEDTIELRGSVANTVASAIAMAANVEALDASGTGSTRLNITGNAFNNTITGNDADNILDGGAGVDTLLAGVGNDTYKVDQNDVVTEAPDEGIDTVEMTATVAGLTFDMTPTGDYANIENFKLMGALAGDVVGNDDNNELTGNATANVLSGAGGDDTLKGLGGDDTLDGGEDNDSLDGGTGVDTMLGGNGDDTYFVDNELDSVDESASDGHDTVKSTVTYGIFDGVEDLYLLGTAAIDAVGNDLDNKIVGNDGANFIDGGAGNDTMIGGKGNDTYAVDSLDDKITELAGGGTDTVEAQITYSIDGIAEVENLTMAEGAGAIDGTGNTSNNVITGNEDANKLDGGNGNDTLLGKGGDDELIGGAGIDTLKGGDGNDLYEVNLVLSGTAAKLEDAVVELANEGDFDTVKLVSATLSNLVTTLTVGANIENLDVSGTGSTKLNLTGNTLNNELTGNDAGNVLDGGGGDDTLIGGDGNDTYKVSEKDGFVDIVTEEVGEGIDTVELTTSSPSTIDAPLEFQMSGDFENVEHFKLLGNAIANVYGNDEDNVITGNGAVNQLEGGIGNDTLYGNAGNDILAGGDNDDILDGGAGVDEMYGGEGDDTYYVDNADDILGDSDGTDTAIASVSYSLVDADPIENLVLTGSAANGTGNTQENQITGNAAANILDGREGADTLIGGAGNDTYFVDDDNDVVTEQVNEGTDTIKSWVTIDLTLTKYANIENVTLLDLEGNPGIGPDIDVTGHGGNNVIIGNSGNNELQGGGGNDTLDGGAGRDILTGGEGIDILKGGAENDDYNVKLVLAGTVVKLEDTVTENAGDEAGEEDAIYLETTSTIALTKATTLVIGANIEGFDASLTDATWINITGNAQKNWIVGNNADNILDGGVGNDSLDAGDGNDTLIGGAGEDELHGGDGDDLYKADEFDTFLEEDGEGTDTIELTSKTAAYELVMGEFFENAKVLGNVATNVTGNEEDNVITGNAAANTLTGGDGNDTLDGGAGIDTLLGGIGDDTYIIDNLKDSVDETDGDGIDTVKTSVAIIDKFDDVENYTYTGTAAWTFTGTDDDNRLEGGAGIDTLSGGLGNDTLIGNGGNDSLDGGEGEDAMTGGAGNDTYFIDDALDEVTEAANQGIDTIKSWIAIALGDYLNVENLTLMDVTTGVGDDLNGEGSDGANVIIGNSGDNLINGGIGNDTLEGRGGDDDLVGGTGIDSLKGGAGNDTYEVNLVQSGTAAKLEDTVSEEANDDTGDKLVLTGTVATTTATTIVLAAGFEELDASGASVAKLNLTGNAAANVITGNEFDNTIDGGAGNDTLLGGDGNDILIGGAGVDDLQGGEDDDTYRVDENDTITEDGTTDNDTIEMTATKVGLTFTVADEVENFKLLGKFAGDVDGNTLDNYITGNAAANVLKGGDGNDTLDGGTGNDTLWGGTGDDIYIVDSLNDVVNETGGFSSDIDTIKTSVLLQLTTNEIENYTYTGTGAWSFTGTSEDNRLEGGSGADTLNGGIGDDTLVGNGGNDILDGGADNDTMIGGAGNDTYFVRQADDDVVEDNAIGSGIDTIQAFIDIDLTNYANVENVTYKAFTPTGDLTGNTLNNILNAAAALGQLDINGLDGNDVITGSAFDDTLNGGKGNDTLIGGAGHDTLSGDFGVDILQGGAGDDDYHVNLAQSGTSAKLEDTVTEAAGAANGTEDSIYLHNENSVVLTKALVLTVNANVENFDFHDTGTLLLNVTGNALDNEIIGNDGKNVIIGGNGNDWLNGGGGDDTLTGGAGNDTFEIDDVTADQGDDVITDFNEAQDKLAFHDVVDSNGSGSIIDEIDDLITGIDDAGAGKDVVIHFDSGGSLTLKGLGIAAGTHGTIDDILDPSHIISVV
jgi:Ca2+-binding RTX toxin-like protein